MLSGATHLAPHYGLINTKLRAHLPLLIPTDPAPVFVVAGQNLTWTEGTMIVFDDTFEHEVSFALEVSTEFRESYHSAPYLLELSPCF